jgi:hypothetical protein
MSCTSLGIDLSIKETNGKTKTCTVVFVHNLPPRYEGVRSGVSNMTPTLSADGDKRPDYRYGRFTNHYNNHHLRRRYPDVSNIIIKGDLY